MEPITMMLGASVISGLFGLASTAIQSKAAEKNNKEFTELWKGQAQSSKQDLNTMKGIAMQQSGTAGPQMAAPGAYPWG